MAPGAVRIQAFKIERASEVFYRLADCDEVALGGRLSLIVREMGGLIIVDCPRANLRDAPACMPDYFMRRDLRSGDIEHVGRNALLLCLRMRKAAP